MVLKSNNKKGEYGVFGCEYVMEMKMKKGLTALSMGGIGAFIAGIPVYFFMRRKLMQNGSVTYKNERIIRLYKKWHEAKMAGGSVSDYLGKYGYKRVAIYGFHYMGDTLYKELRESPIEVVYAIDRNADSMSAELPIYRPDEDLQEVDAVIVTAFTVYDEVEELLSEELSCPILSLEDIINEI